MNDDDVARVCLQVAPCVHRSSMTRGLVPPGSPARLEAHIGESPELSSANYPRRAGVPYFSASGSGRDLMRIRQPLNTLMAPTHERSQS
jgi:hypothetical protein